jgi:mono/diheme cytochrome c family protein
MNRSLVAALALAAAAAGISISTSSAGAPSDEALAARGKYLVTAFGCADCHTPWKMGAEGPEPDQARFMSGHPAELVMPPAPKLPPGPWLGSFGATNTAWAGPWGVSFTANLTSDPETGLGKWTEDNFVQAIRTGRHMGKGRPILPPMPAPALANLDDADLRSVFAYLHTVKPIRNRVPEPGAPATAAAQK